MRGFGAEAVEQVRQVAPPLRVTVAPTTKVGELEVALTPARQEGFRVALFSRSADRLEAFVDELTAEGVETVAFPADLADQGSGEPPKRRGRAAFAGRTRPATLVDVLPAVVAHGQHGSTPRLWNCLWSTRASARREVDQSVWSLSVPDKGM